MAGLGFSSGTGEFKPYVSYSAKAGKWSMKKDGVDVDIDNPTFVADLANIKTGYSYFATGRAPQHIWNPSLSVKAPRPTDVDGKGKSLYKESFLVEFFSQKNFGGVVEFTSSSQLVREAMNVLYIAYESGLAANPGKLPVVTCEGTTKTVSNVKTDAGDTKVTNYTPIFKITSWVARPSEFDTATAANQSAAPVQKASVSEF